MRAVVLHTCLRDVVVLTTALVSAACESTRMTAPEAVTPLATSNGSANQAPDTTPAAVNAELAQLRRLTAPYHNIDAAMAAGYTVLVTPCLELPGVGGMGYHYGHPTYLGDPAVNALQPELLLYEPQKNGQLRFMGVEYIIPFDQLPPTADPPMVLGQHMHRNFEANIWALHAWVGRHNPTGIFEDWNPLVSCQFAS